MTSKRPKPVRANTHKLSLAVAALVIALAASAAVMAQPLDGREQVASLTEEDYFASLPVVLTVSRLTQPISDTPGAVTIIDRQTIRRMGARDLTDLLRLVPGYIVSGYNGGNPTGVYHAPIDEYGTRNLVLIDGRSVYSFTYLGGTNRGMMSVPIEDVERVEVLRGSNSAAYGANAVFGVINIVTRHSADTLGGEVSVSSGTQDIQDEHVRLGWGSPDASFRLSAGQRRDSGYEFVFDDRKVDNLHWRGDIRLGADTELMLKAGYTQVNTQEGYAWSPDNPQRTVTWANRYLHGLWKRQLSPTESVKVSASWEEGHTKDAAPYGPIPSVIIDFGSKDRRLNLEYQHQRSFGESVRAVWGAGYVAERAWSAPMFNQANAVKTDDLRVFGNVEWGLAPGWMLNAGLFAGRDSELGSYAWPRLMVNYQLAPGHTLRAGVAYAQRTPTLFERESDVRYLLPGNTVVRTFASSGTVQPERLTTREISYFGHFPDARLTLDVRAFNEAFRDNIEDVNVGGSQRDFVNRPGFDVRGVEYQIRWSPLEDTQVWLNQSFLDMGWRYAVNIDRQPPRKNTTLALFQRLNHGWDVTLLVHARDSMNWRRSSDNMLEPATRVDLRVARQFRLGQVRAEAAMTLHSLNGDQQEFLSVRPTIFQRRIFATLRLEF